MSFMKTKNNRGPKIERWGTLDFTGSHAVRLGGERYQRTSYHEKTHILSDGVCLVLNATYGQQ